MKALEQKLNHNFKDPQFLIRALHHRSAEGPSNERLEFIGDSILGFIIATEIYAKYPSIPEGALSRLRANLVKQETLAKLAHDLTIGDYLYLGLGENKSGGWHRDSILADALEAIIAAIYLDSGIETCRNCVLGWYDREFPDWSEAFAKDPKSILQEYLQAKKFPLPFYDIVKTKGEAHAQTFHIKCTVEGLTTESTGTGQTIQKAEQQAAANFLEALSDD